MTDPSESPPARPRRRRDSAASAAATDASTPETESLAATTPTRVEVSRGAVGRMEATTIDVHQGAVGAAQAGSVSIEQGAVGGVLGSDVELRRSVVRGILARSVRVEQSFVRTLVAGEVRVERATGVGFLIARRVVGDVRVLLDWRGALAFGAGAGLVMSLLRRGRRRGDPEGAGDKGRKGRKRA
jgi:hypothetical protein